MRPVAIFAIVVMLPALYLGFNDYMKYQSNPAAGFHFSTIGEVWMDHDRAGFSQYKAEYKTRVREWEEDVRPYLEWNAFSTALTPGLAINLGLLICWLLGVGPFKNWSPSIGAPGAKGSGFARSSAAEKGGKFEYKRK
jgi:hypothetical protein